MDWATNLIGQINWDEDDATKAFRAAYATGDSPEAAEQMRAMATRRIERGEYQLLIFADGSGYCDWRAGIDCFAPDWRDLVAAEDDAELTAACAL